MNSANNNLNYPQLLEIKTNTAAANVEKVGFANAVPLAKAFAYAAPSAGAFFFYIPMWSILPGMYSKHFGLSLAAVATVVLTLRVFDGLIIPIIGYLSDRHHTAGGSRKPWVVAGYLGVIIACYFLFQPPASATTSYYLIWSLMYFVCFMIGEIPHVTWGNELTLEYKARARIFGVRTFVFSFGTFCFYALPLLPIYPTSDYTPQVLRDAVYVGAVMMVAGLTWALLYAPASVAVHTRPQDSAALLLRSLFQNRPFLVYLAGFVVTGIAYGMWYGLVFFFLDSYLGLGAKVAIIFLLSNVVSAASTPFLLKVIGWTSKSTAWAIGVALFFLQLFGAWFVTPSHSWWLSFVLVAVAHLCFNCHNIAAISILGDIADYGKLKFNKDRTATYFGVNNLVFQVALGLGGGIALTIADSFGFKPTMITHTSQEVLGLKLAFVLVPSILALLGLPIILRTPITKRRHRIIQRRLETRIMGTRCGASRGQV